MARLWAEIDGDKWAANYRAIAQAAAPARVVPVLKSDGYGLGAVAAAETFQRAGVTRVAVATVAEARELQGLGLEIQFLGVPEPEEIPDIVQMNAVGSVPDRDTARRFSAAAIAVGRDVRIHVLVDTGMGRLGFLISEAAERIQEIADLPGIRIEGIYSHFPLAEAPDRMAAGQVQSMCNLVKWLEKKGLHLQYVHMANSYAVCTMREIREGIFNMVRPGIELHGAGDMVLGEQRLAVQPVMTLKAKLLAVRELPPGFTVGYGCTYTLKETERIGTVAIGYADGYPRSLSNRGRVLVHGIECPVVGSVCMDYIQVSLAAVPAARPGDEVVLVGRQGRSEVTVQQLARAAGTISYEILTHLGARVERRYLNRR